MGGILQNAHGNLLALNYGEQIGAPPSPGQGGHLYNLATNGSNCGEALYNFEVGQPIALVERGRDVVP